MGMFDKDKEFGNRLDQVVGLKQPFVLLGVSVPKDRTIETDFGTAQVAELRIVRMHHGRSVGQPIDTTTIASAIVDKAKASKKDDFPCVVELRKVDSRFGTEALVIQWLGDYDSSAASSAVPIEGEDDIPY